MLKVYKKILRAIARFLVHCTSRKLRQKIYALFFIGPYLQRGLNRVFGVMLGADDFEWVNFGGGCRDGLTIKLKLPEENEFFLETHDPDVTGLLCKYILPGFTVVDVGAHIGYFTLLISRLAGEGGGVLAVEPLSKNAARLKENLSRNHCRNTQVFEFAAADADGQEEFLDFNLATIGRLASAGSFTAGGSISGRCLVQCRRLDSLIRQNPLDSLDFVKIDVEGAELRVLKGAEGLLNRFKPILLVELHDEKIIPEITSFLRHKGYSSDIDTRVINKTTFFPDTLLGTSILFEAR